VTVDDVRGCKRRLSGDVTANGMVQTIAPARQNDGVARLRSQAALEDTLQDNRFVVLRILGAADERYYACLLGGINGLVDCVPGGRVP